MQNSKINLNTLSAAELLQKLKNKEITPEEILISLDKRISEVDSKVRAYVRIDQKTEGTAESLKGIPVSIKDNICTEGLNTECCSKILEGFRPPYDATVIKKLKEAGADILGLKTNMDEFAFGSSTENSYFYPTHNPWDLERVPGGSSGGSAAAVAADEAICALGSDTGGSIRQPAAFCGVVGLKPTYGRVSRYGFVAFCSSLDQIGPLTKTVEDFAILLNVMAGHDPLDSTSANVPCPDYTKALRSEVKGLKIGLPEEYFISGLDKRVEAAVKEAAQTLAKMGAEIKTIKLPHTQYAVAVNYIVAVAEASSNLGRFDGVRFGHRIKSNDLLDMYLETRDHGFGAEAKRRILLGTFVLSAGYYDAYYLKGQKVRTLIKRDFQKAFQEVDLLMSATSPTTAFKIGEKIDDPLAMYLSGIMTIPANLAGI